jgi:ketosteroid isomerase-like protein
MRIDPTSRRESLIAGAALLTVGCARTPDTAFSLADRIAQVRAAETAFAKTMADRDFAAFAAFIADDAVFVNSGAPLRGKAAVLDHWKRFFAPGPAPFAWKPELVEVAATGALGYSEGPVWSGSGPPFARYFSTWRRGAGGAWQIVFDNGYALPKAPAA